MADKHTSNGNDTNTNPSRKIHVVLLPFVAFGHMMPFHQLAVALADSGVGVSFVSTARNLHRLPKPPPSLAHLITLVALPFPSSPLPDGAEATVDVSMDQMPLIHAAFDALKEPFDNFVSESSPDFIIIDFIPHWAADVASDRGVPLLTFSAFSAVTKVFFGPPEYLTGEGQKRVRSSTESLTSPPPWVDFPSSVSFRHFEAVGTLAGFYGANPSGFSPAQRIAKTLQACQAMAIRSCRELEGEYLSLFAKLLGKPVIPVGLLPPPETPKTTIADETWTRSFKWLDGQRPRSVVFVGFGSECRLSKEQIHEIAHGLEASGLPFLWALRKPSWATDGLDAMPEGFYSRNFQKWVVCIGWAPQMEILAHQAVGGSLFHAGWGSVIETLQFGHALVALPLIIEQPLNARLLVEKGLAIEVERRADGSFSRDGIAKALREAMVSEDGENMRARLRETAAMVGNQKLHKRYVDEFVEYLKNEAVKK